MKQKQRGSIHIILLSVVVVLIGGALTYALLKNTASKSNVTLVADSTSQSDESNTALDKNSASQPAEIGNGSQNQAYAEFSDFRVRFPTSIKYALKRNSGTGNMAGYWISIDSLAQTCTTPNTPWLGFIGQYTPSDLVENGPETGKSYEQIFGKQGMTINGKLYVFKAMTQLCTRNEPNPAVEQAAEKLKSEIEHLEAY